MKQNQLKKYLISFLSNIPHPLKPFLLGLSGGPDSLALFFCLLECQKEIHFDFSVAHIDHGWRSESHQEAEILHKLVTSHAVPFYLKQLDPHSLHGNLEAACRQERLNFFYWLCQTEGYQSVMLGHHQDDQAETVLKRLFEGSALSSLAGLRERHCVGGLEVWRPWLRVTKKEIQAWLNQHTIDPFEDSTNADPRFLRARFRKQIMPSLSERFGKEISSSLCRIGAEAEELSAYLTDRVASHLVRIEQSKRGIYLDLQTICPSSIVELKFLLKKIGEVAGCPFSYPLLQIATRLIHEKVANRELSLAGKLIILDRGNLFIPHAQIDPLPASIPLKPGEYTYGSWKIRVTYDQPESLMEMKTGWKHAWEGVLKITIPQGQYRIGPPDVRAYLRQKTTLDRWWTNHKVPSFLRSKIPVISTFDSITHEFLSGKVLKSSGAQMLVELSS